MALFNRKKNQTISELENYYSNRNNQPVRAWLMAFLSLFVTITVLLALFFGGRWVYRTLTDDTTVVTTTESSSSDTEDSNATSTEQTPTVSVGPSEPNGVVSDEAARTSSSNSGGTNTSTPSAVGSTVASNSNLPNTGNGEVIFVVPALAGAFGYVVSRRRYSRQ